VFRKEKNVASKTEHLEIGRRRVAVSGARRSLGLTGGGPAMSSLLGCYEFTDGEMVLTSLHPGCTLEQMRNNIGWNVRVSADLKTTGEPTSEKLRIVGEELDPAHLYI
jgi:glutaconate CoA-transferase subunit B